VIIASITSITGLLVIKHDNLQLYNRVLAAPGAIISIFQPRAPLLSFEETKVPEIMK